MGQALRLYGLSAIIFLVFDLFWLLVVSKKMYQHFIGHLMGQVKILPAIIFYFIYLIGIVFFVLLPGIDKNSLRYVLSAGALFGLICYATYDLTNLATLQGWPLKMTIIDLLWGSFATAGTAVIVYVVNNLLFRGA